MPAMRCVPQPSDGGADHDCLMVFVADWTERIDIDIDDDDNDNDADLP